MRTIRDPVTGKVKRNKTPEIQAIEKELLFRLTVLKQCVYECRLDHYYLRYEEMMETFKRWETIMINSKA